MGHIRQGTPHPGQDGSRRERRRTTPLDHFLNRAGARAGRGSGRVPRRSMRRGPRTPGPCRGPVAGPRPARTVPRARRGGGEGRHVRTLVHLPGRANPLVRRPIRRPRRDDRPVQAPPGHRRGWHGHRLHGRAEGPREEGRRPEGHQARHGHCPGRGPVRGRAPGPGDDGPPFHRQGARRRSHPDRPALLRHGAGQGRPHHRVLRHRPPHAQGTPRTLHPGLRGGPARAPEGDHPPRPQALECAGGDAGRHAGSEGDRLRNRQGDQPEVDGAFAVHAARRDRGDSRVHEPRAGRDVGDGRRHADGRVRAGGDALRAADRLHAPGARPAAGFGLRGDPQADQGGRAAEAEHPAERVARVPSVGRGAAEDGTRPADKARPRRPRLDRDEGDREGPSAALRDGQRPGTGHPAPSRWRRRGGVPAVGAIQAVEVRPQALGPPGDGRGVRVPAGGRDGDQHRAGLVGGSPAGPGDARRRRGEGPERPRRTASGWRSTP